jgi:hypothetical protein
MFDRILNAIEFDLPLALCRDPVLFAATSMLLDGIAVSSCILCGIRVFTVFDDSGTSAAADADADTFVISLAELAK